MPKPKTFKIPKLQANQLDDYLFGTWKPVVSELYDNFHIVRIEEYKNHMVLPILPHRRFNYFFFFLTNGQASRSKNLNQYEIAKYDFYCLPAFQITSMDFMSDDIKGFYCHFKPEIFNQPQLKVDIERDFPFFDITAEPLVKVSNGERVVQMLELLYTEYKRNEMKRSNIVAFHLAVLLNEVNFDFKVPQNNASSASSYLTQQYKNILSEGIENLKRVVDAAKSLGVTPNHLNKCVKETTGKSAHELLVDMRILQAKVLLKQTDFPIKEIAYKVGGFESSDFAKFFKKRTDMTPSEYRGSVS